MTREKLNQKKQKEIFDEEKKETRKKILLVLLKILLVITILAVIFYLLNTYIFTAKLVVREKRVVSEKIPDSFDGLKIVHFSDLHYGSTIYIPEVKSLVKKINELSPDIVVFTGDLIDKNYDIDSKEQEKIIKELLKVKATVGKYAIDGDEDKKNFSAIFNQSGFNVLNNNYDLIYNDSKAPILLVGISSMLSESSNLESAFSYFEQEKSDANIYTVVLAHEPDLTDQILDKYNADLVLAGHSHNGYVRFFNGKPLFKVDGALKYDEEYYRLQNTDLYISSGVGTNGSGIRIFCMPSISLYRLSSK